MGRVLDLPAVAETLRHVVGIGLELLTQPLLQDPGADPELRASQPLGVGTLPELIDALGKLRPPGPEPAQTGLGLLESRDRRLLATLRGRGPPVGPLGETQRSGRNG